MNMLKSRWKNTVIVSAIGALFLTIVCRSFSISPLKYHLTLTPGVTNHVIALMVKNTSPVKQLYKFKVLGARQIQSGQLVFAEMNSAAETWVRPEVNAAEILPNTEKKINFLISIPKEAAAGSYYLGMAAESAAGGGERQVGVSGQLVSVLLLQVAGVVNESLSIVEWKIPGFTSGKEWPATFSLFNSSATELPVKGEIIVRDWLGREVTRENVNLGLPLLPSAGRNFSATVRLPKKLLLPGVYQAEVRVKYGLTNQTAVAIKNVWYTPLYLWILLFVAFIAGILAIKRRKKV